MSRSNTYDASKYGITAGAAAVELQFDMTPGRQYKLRARGADAWFRLTIAGGTAAAVATDNSHFLPQGQEVQVSALALRNRISFIRDGATDVSVILSEVPGVANSG